MRPTIVVVHDAFAESASDPLSPIWISPTEDIYRTDPLALDPLSPVPAGARPIEAGRSNSESTSERA